MEAIWTLLAVFGIAGISWATTKIHQNALDNEQLSTRLDKLEQQARSHGDDRSGAGKV